MKEELNRLLLQWYAQNARVLPWRGQSDPYAIWVSEIMLQQTRVETVIPYFHRWMQALPSVDSLAKASQDQVLKLWEGLGYYSRALSLQKAARILQKEHGSALPADFSQLQNLPGIGPYTAAAIASIAFGLDHAVVDGNVKRVLARLLNYDKPVNTPEAEKELRLRANSLLAAGQAGDFNQAMMELGALVCVPRKPDCTRCPLTGICRAYQNNLQRSLPVMKPQVAIPHYTVTAGILHNNGDVLIAQRPAGSLLGGMWEFPGGKVSEGETHAVALQRELREELGIDVEAGAKLGKFQHAYTHFKVTLFAYHVDPAPRTVNPISSSAVKWVQLHELANFPMGKIDRQISRALVNEHSDG